MLTGFILGFVVGTALTGLGFIIFGKNNKNHIAEARAAILKKADDIFNVQDLSDDVRNKVTDLRKDVSDKLRP